MYWLRVCQADSFSSEIEALKKKARLLKSSCLISLRPLIDDKQLLRVGGRQENARHPVIQSSDQQTAHPQRVYYMLVLY